MYDNTISTIIVNLYLLWPISVDAVRISPKLDFGESNMKPLSAGFRPDTETRYLRNNSGTKSNYRTDAIKLENIEVICISGNCTATKPTTENVNGISADVLVHVKTNFDVFKTKNDTFQPIPDIPIVVGTKSTTVSTLNNNRPLSAPNSVVYHSNYPIVNLLPPISTNTAFIPSRPSSGPVFVQNSQLDTDSENRGYRGIANYAPIFQGANNDISLQTTYFGSPFNNNDNVNNNRPIAPRPAFYPKGVRGENYNPVEFRKTYNNNWSPVKWARDDPSNADRRTGSGIRRWTPCVCQNPELHQYPTTPTYPQRSQSSGINGKLTPLV